RKKETIQYLKENGFFLDYRKRAVILRIKYKQHKYDPNNIREERALSVLRQEIIHPLTGEICSHLNIIKDTSYMTLILNDIVRGEYSGRVKYKRELIENTESHEKRLKFLYAWLSKHQRRIIGYSDEFFASVIKVLDHYLLNPDYRESFNDLHKLHREVWNKYSYIKQARKIRILEELLDSKYIKREINYLTALLNINQILGELKFELADYYDEMVCKTISMLDKMVNDSYLLKRYIHTDKPDTLTEYGLKVRKNYGRMVSQLDELRSIRKCKSGQARKENTP
ncbi:MAG: hypothetical protein ACOCV7_07080, partial [Desulfonatronovibrionaceae bacterium]